MLSINFTEYKNLLKHVRSGTDQSTNSGLIKSELSFYGTKSKENTQSTNQLDNKNTNHSSAWLVFNFKRECKCMRHLTNDKTNKPIVAKRSNLNLNSIEHNLNDPTHKQRHNVSSTSTSISISTHTSNCKTIETLKNRPPSTILKYDADLINIYK